VDSIWAQFRKEEWAEGKRVQRSLTNGGLLQQGSIGVEEQKALSQLQATRKLFVNRKAELIDEGQCIFGDLWGQTDRDSEQQEQQLWLRAGAQSLKYNRNYTLNLKYPPKGSCVEGLVPS
jgi:hypothetical protein